jgi:protein TonB
MKHFLYVLFLIIPGLSKGQDTADIVESDSIRITATVRQVAEFPGEIQELYKYLQKNIKYPAGVSCDPGFHNCYEGKVYLTFTVEADGSISGIKILKSITDAPWADKEAIRIVSAMPKWEPARMQQKPVPMQVQLPIKFNYRKE